MSDQTIFLSLGCLTKRTRADRFLEEMNRVVPWGELAGVVEPHYRAAASGAMTAGAALDMIGRSGRVYFMV